MLFVACGDDDSSDNIAGDGHSIVGDTAGSTGADGTADGSGPGMEPPLGDDNEADGEASGPGMEPPVADGSAAAGDGAFMDGDTSGGNVAEPTTGPDGARDNEADMALVDTPEFDAVTDTCGTNCVLSGGVDCVTNCLATETGVSTECARCYDGIVNCSAQSCWDMCIFDSAGEACRNCVAVMCEPAFDQCRGIPPVEDPPPAS